MESTPTFKIGKAIETRKDSDRMHTWFVGNFDNLGIPDGYLVGFYPEAQEYKKNSTYEDIDLFYAAIALQELYGEYDESYVAKFNIDRELDLAEKVDNTLLSHYFDLWDEWGDGDEDNYIFETVGDSLLSDYPELYEYFSTQKGFGVLEYYTMLYAVCEAEQFYSQFPIDPGLDIQNPTCDFRLTEYCTLWDEWMRTEDWGVEEYDMILFAVQQAERCYTKFPIDMELDLHSTTRFFPTADYISIYAEWLDCDEWGMDEYDMITFALYQAEEYSREEKTSDKINPDHYKWIPGVECKQVTDHLNFNLGSAFKYIYRNGRKPTESSVEDLRKAIKFIEFEIERLENDYA